MNNKLFITAAIAFGLAHTAVSMAAADNASKANFATKVNTLIGTDYTGNTYPGAQTPFGMVQLSPDNGLPGWDRIAGYFYPDSTIAGFSHTHLSGTGAGDLYDISFLPVTLPLNDAPAPLGIHSKFSHDDETAHAGYYQVRLTDYDINVELTATPRCGVQRYTFPNKGRQRMVILNLTKAMNWDATKDTKITQIDKRTIEGYRFSDGWARNQRVWFRTRFSQPIENIQLERTELKTEDGHVTGYGYVARILFATEGPSQLTFVTALSATGQEGASKNLAAEAPNDDFDYYRNQVEKQWNRELGKIEVEGGTPAQQTTFYTALYHAMIAPTLFNDVDGTYMGADRKIHHASGWNNYETCSLWDTYRAAHPLATIIMPDRMPDYAKTMMAIFREHGELPMWHLTSNETYCMVGEPGIPVLADMILKNECGDINLKEAYEAMKASLLPTEYSEVHRLPLRGKDYLAHLGFLPYDGREGETVAKNLEYYLASWAVAQVAGRLGYKQDSIRFYNLSQNYRKLWDQRVKCMRAIDSKGNLRPLPQDFNPQFQTGDYTEGNPWQYAFLVPHDVNGLAELMGGKDSLNAHLDALLNAPSDLGDNHNPDISGLIGQYAHGNEPSHHVLYMYNYVGQPRKTQRRVRQVMDELYTDQPAGLCGNEDVGQMSAWYIMSALGLYQVEPCGGVYQLGSPIVEEAVIPLPGDKTFTIRTHGGSDKAYYVKKYVLNGKTIKGTTILHSQIMAGGTLDVYMSEK